MDINQFVGWLSYRNQYLPKTVDTCICEGRAFVMSGFDDRGRMGMKKGWKFLDADGQKISSDEILEWLDLTKFKIIIFKVHTMTIIMFDTPEEATLFSMGINRQSMVSP